VNLLDKYGMKKVIHIPHLEQFGATMGFCGIVYTFTQNPAITRKGLQKPVKSAFLLLFL
jgi:hypothetical protein